METTDTYMAPTHIPNGQFSFSESFKFIGVCWYLDKYISKVGKYSLFQIVGKQFQIASNQLSEVSFQSKVAYCKFNFYSRQFTIVPFHFKIASLQFKIASWFLQIASRYSKTHCCLNNPDFNFKTI